MHSITCFSEGLGLSIAMFAMLLDICVVTFSSEALDGPFPSNNKCNNSFKRFLVFCCLVVFFLFSFLLSAD